jgi:hypothetical protein
MLPAARLSAHAPPMEPLHAHGLHSILGVHAGEHASLCPQGHAAQHSGRVTSYERHACAAGLGQRWRVGHTLPLPESPAPIRGNGIEYGAIGADRVQHCRWGTDRRVRQRNV